MSENEIILRTEDVSYEDDEDVEEVEDFDYTGYEVVRREFYLIYMIQQLILKMIAFNLIQLA